MKNNNEEILNTLYNMIIDGNYLRNNPPMINYNKSYIKQIKYPGKISYKIFKLLFGFYLVISTKFPYKTMFGKKKQTKKEIEN